jgi:hypothetical protein
MVAEPEEHHQVDADVLLGFTQRLHEVRDRVERASTSDEQRRRWQARLAAISEGAADDLDRAVAQLGRMEADLGRWGA